MLLDFLLGSRKLATWNDERFWTDIFSGWGWGPTTSGISVSEDTALNYSAVYRAISLISGSVASLPLHIYRRRSDSNRDRLNDHPLDWLLNNAPNPEMDAITFREVMQSWVLGWGNGYAEIVRAGNRPVQIWPIHPANVRPDVENGQVVYVVTDSETGTQRTLGKDRVFHVKNLGGDGITGWSVIRRARESIGLGLATERFGASFFGNGTKMGGILKHKGRLKPEAFKNLRASIKREHEGPGNANKFMILEEDMDWINPMTSPEDSQYLETRQFQVDEIARWFGLPAHLLGSLVRSSYGSIEAQSLEWLNYGLRYWLVKWEKAIHRSLFTTAEQQDLYAEHLTEAMVRADIVSRYNAFAVAHTNGWMSANDILRRENMNPIGSKGDIYLLPANMVPAEVVEKQIAAAKALPDEDFGPGGGKEPAPVPGENGNGAPKAPTPTDRMAPVAIAHERLLQDALARLARKEIAATRQAAKKPGEFLAWLDGFYPRHEGLMVECLTPVIVAMMTVGLDPAAPEWIADKWTEQSREALLQAAGEATAEQLPEKIEALTATWEQRAIGVDQCKNTSSCLMTT